MKRIIIIVLILSGFINTGFAQKIDSTTVYKKRVLETTELDLLMSYYKQDGDHASVGGGIGSEELTNITPTIVVSIPLNDDDVLTIDAGLSSYTSASSSNINPFNKTGASRGKGGDDEDDDDRDDEDDDYGDPNSGAMGSPWVSSTGASKQDALKSLKIDYSHSSNDRNFISGANIAFSKEYDYTSLGFGGNLGKFFNQKNTEIGFKAQVYLDKWDVIYPTELHEYQKYGSNFKNEGYFKGVTVLNQSGDATTQYSPNQFNKIEDSGRNSYSGSLFLSQILSKRLQISLFVDLVYQDGLLSTPYHRVYFADKSNYYIGDTNDISKYTSRENKGVFQLADDIERLPSTRLKIPIGSRLNYYINETFVLRSYYRYYTDDWGIDAHTASFELPIRLSPAFTITPTYRYYTQTAADYFAPYETHLSTEEFYTSDQDLSKFSSNQYGIGLSYTDIFTKFKVKNFGLKNINVRFNHYDRDDGLKADIISFGLKFIMD